MSQLTQHHAQVAKVPNTYQELVDHFYNTHIENEETARNAARLCRYKGVRELLGIELYYTHDISIDNICKNTIPLDFFTHDKVRIRSKSSNPLCNADDFYGFSDEVAQKYDNADILKLGKKFHNNILSLHFILDTPEYQDVLNTRIIYNTQYPSNYTDDVMCRRRKLQDVISTLEFLDKTDKDVWPDSGVLFDIITRNHHEDLSGLSQKHYDLMKCQTLFNVSDCINLIEPNRKPNLVKGFEANEPYSFPNLKNLTPAQLILPVFFKPCIDVGDMSEEKLNDLIWNPTKAQKILHECLNTPRQVVYSNFSKLRNDTGTLYSLAHFDEGQMESFTEHLAQYVLTDTDIKQAVGYIYSGIELTYQSTQHVDYHPV